MSKTNSETITNIELDKLAPFKSHPYIVRDDEQILMLVFDRSSLFILSTFYLCCRSNGMFI